MIQVPGAYYSVTAGRVSGQRRGLAIQRQPMYCEVGRSPSIRLTVYGFRSRPQGHSHQDGGRPRRWVEGELAAKQH